MHAPFLTAASQMKPHLRTNRRLSKHGPPSCIRPRRQLGLLASRIALRRVAVSLRSSLSRDYGRALLRVEPVRQRR